MKPNSPSAMYPKFYPLSESAITVEWGDRIADTPHQQVLNLDHALHQAPFSGFLETVPTYVSLTIYYQAELIPVEDSAPFQWVKDYLEVLIQQAASVSPAEKNLLFIPVCYDPEFGYDLDFVAATHGISIEKVIELHQKTAYKVFMMGFLPGFAYLGALDNAIATARKPTPRAKVEAGSVGIAGNQTGIYPLNSPGGWQIIGRTPCSLFDPAKTNPFLLKTGDTVQFYAISKESFYQTENTRVEMPEAGPTVDPADAVVIKAGVFSTIQDRGRFWFRAYGVPLGGAMDTVAHHLANALVGNTKQAASIECTMGGLIVQFKKEALIAVTGEGAALLNDISIPLYQPHPVSQNDVLTLKFNQKGIRTYLAVQGGFVAESLLNSKSTCAMVGIGSPLTKGQELRFDKDISTIRKKTEGKLPLPAIVPDKIIRLFPGPEYPWLTAESAQQFYTQEFTLSNRCDRMGFHLQAEPLLLNHPRELLSTAVTMGTIQLTPNGQLILLMSDCQTTGGYPRVGQIAAIDLPKVAQLIPGETITFEPVSFAEAEALYLLQQKAIHALFD